MDDPLPTQARKRIPFRTVAVVVLWLFLIVLLADTAGWLYPAWKKSRAESFASQAQDAFEAENFREAEEQVAAALQMRPLDARFLRLAGRIYAAQRKVEATAYYISLLKTNEALDRDRFEYLDFALDLQRPDLAQPFLREKSPVSAEDLYYRARWLDVSGDLAGALKMAREAVAADSSRLQFRFLLADILIKTRDAGGIDEAKKILMDIAAKNFRERSRATRMLARIPLSQRELLQLAKWLRENPGLRADDYFLSAELLFGANSNALQALANEAISRYGRGVPLERAALGRWLNRRGLFELTLTNIAPEIKSPTVTAVHLEALIGARKWEEALQLGKSAERASVQEIAGAIYERLSTNSPVSAEAAEGLKRVKMPPKPAAQ